MVLHHHSILMTAEIKVILILYLVILFPNVRMLLLIGVQKREYKLYLFNYVYTLLLINEDMFLSVRSIK